MALKASRAVGSELRPRTLLPSKTQESKNLAFVQAHSHSVMDHQSLDTLTTRSNRAQALGDRMTGEVEVGGILDSQNISTLTRMFGGMLKVRFQQLLQSPRLVSRHKKQKKLCGNHGDPVDGIPGKLLA